MAMKAGNITIVVDPEGQLVEVTQDGTSWEYVEAKEGENVSLVWSPTTVTRDNLAALTCRRDPITGRLICSFGV